MKNTLIELLHKKTTKWKEASYVGCKPETRTILSYINKVRFLRPPQVEALETYIYLKEIVGNKTTDEVLKSLVETENDLLDLLPLTTDEENKILKLDNKTEKIQELLIQHFADFSYPNQVYALTMGSGKTILMATMLAYEFLLASEYPEDNRFSKNILVFAPDKTIIESLKEIKTFDYSKVLPRQFQNILLNVKFHYLESTDTQVNFIGNFNLIVSNSQKIIIKTKHKKDNKLSLLTNEKERKEKSIINRRLIALQGLENLAIFVDEAHHSYGNDLNNELKKTRETISYLNTNGVTKIVNVANFTGTPFFKNRFIKDVVYYYGLKQGTEDGILKQVTFIDYENVKSDVFINEVIEEFLKKYSGIKLEGKVPKIAFYASSIDELTNVLKPALEKILLKKKISINTVLEYHTKAEKNKDEFLKLDTNESKKQFILLVGKGTEGWNLRSLVSTALYRKPTSNIFVLQSTTRCLRSIGDNKTKATIFLSSENAKILDNELENNFGINRAELESTTKEKIELDLKVLKKKKLKVTKQLKEILSIEKISLDKIKLPSQDKIIESLPQVIMSKKDIIFDKKDNEAKLTSKKMIERVTEDIKIIIKYPLIHKIAEKTHLTNIQIFEILKNSKYKLDISLSEMKIDELAKVISNSIISQYFAYNENIINVEEIIELTKNFPFKLTRDKDKNSLVVYKEDSEETRFGFHINPYTFDSSDEKALFTILSDKLKHDEVIKDIYFTGNISETSHTDFYFKYYNPETDSISNYFPDFLVETDKKRFLVIEVKGNDKKNDYLANKDNYSNGDKKIFNNVFAKEIGFEKFKELNKEFEYHIIFNAKLEQNQNKLLKKITSWKNV